MSQTLNKNDWTRNLIGKLQVERRDYDEEYTRDVMVPIRDGNRGNRRQKRQEAVTRERERERHTRGTTTQPWGTRGSWGWRVNRMERRHEDNDDKRTVKRKDTKTWNWVWTETMNSLGGKLDQLLRRQTSTSPARDSGLYDVIIQFSVCRKRQTI